MGNLIATLQKIVDFLKKIFANKEVAADTSIPQAVPEAVATPQEPQVIPTPPVTTTPTTPPDSDETESTEPVKPPHPAPSTPLVRLQYDKLQRSKDGSGGFCYNPANSRNTLKVIFPAEYTDHIVEVVAQGVKDNGKLLERLSNAQPGEWGNRERYYGKKSLDQYPKKLIVAIRLDDGKVLAWQIDDVNTRQD